MFQTIKNYLREQHNHLILALYLLNAMQASVLTEQTQERHSIYPAATHILSERTFFPETKFAIPIGMMNDVICRHQGTTCIKAQVLTKLSHCTALLINVRQNDLLMSILYAIDSFEANSRGL